MTRRGIDATYNVGGNSIDFLVVEALARAGVKQQHTLGTAQKQQPFIHGGTITYSEISHKFPAP
jgi:hypothetical protein